MKIVQLLTVLSLTILPAQSVFSDDQIENIIVTGTRIPTQISESLSAVTLFQRADIERLQASDLFDLMSHVPGSSLVRNGGRGSSTSMSLRGNQSDHTLFLMDGFWQKGMKREVGALCNETESHPDTAPATVNKSIWLDTTVLRHGKVTK